MADETLDQIKDKQLSLGELLTRVLRRLHDEFHEQWDAKEEEGGDHEADESDNERQAESDRALKLLRVAYPDMVITVEHESSEESADKSDDKKPAKDDEKDE